MIKNAKNIITMTLLMGLSSFTHAEQWIFLKQTTQNNIYVDAEKVRQVEVDNQRYKQAWIKTVALQDNTAMQRAKGDYTQALWRFDCANATSSILNYVDYDKAGQIVDSGFIENPSVQVVIPNSIEENALLAVCDGKYPKQNAVAKATNQLTTAGNKAVKKTTQATSSAKQTATTAKQTAQTKATQATTATAQTKATQATTATAQTTNVAKQAVQNKATQAVNATKQATSTTAQAAQNKANQATTATKQVASTAKQTVQTKTNQTTSTAKQTVQNKVDKAIKTVNNEASKK